jgi:DNA primase small subunit
VISLARLFPYDLMFNWLSYGNDPDSDKSLEKDFFSRREWSFTVEEIYMRYQSFRDKDEMIAAIKKRQPHKIDIGAVFSAPPKDHTMVPADKFKPLERELVFDIDMTDYDDIRTCCTGANICLKCWPFMTMSVKIVDKALREDFAFKHILWIYSGRRGVHCWVCDPEARSLSNEARGAIVDYLSVSSHDSKENSDRKSQKAFNSDSVHPSLLRAYDILEPFFGAFIADELNGQGLLSSKNLEYRKILNTLPDESIRTQLDSEWQKSKNRGIEKWNQLIAATTPPKDSALIASSKKNKRVNYHELVCWRQELVFKYCYPRLDANVSKTQNHLLKSPFCIHPKTGRVCIPIDPATAETFNPFDVPTVRTLCSEVRIYLPVFVTFQFLCRLITLMQAPVVVLMTKLISRKPR